MKRTCRSPNFWFALILLIANGAAWAYALAPEGPAVKVEPRLEPELAALRDKLIEGGHSGEAFVMEVTDHEAAETIAWYLGRHPNVPFRDPQVSIRPGGITAQGVAEIAGLRVGLDGRATIVLENGVPIVTLVRLEVAGVGVPGFVRAQIQSQIDAQFKLAQSLPVIIDEIRPEEGRAIVRGKIR